MNWKERRRSGHSLFNCAIPEFAWRASGKPRISCQNSLSLVQGLNSNFNPEEGSSNFLFLCIHPPDWKIGIITRKTTIKIFTAVITSDLTRVLNFFVNAARGTKYYLNSTFVVRMPHYVHFRRRFIWQRIRPDGAYKRLTSSVVDTNL
jgi:hypothetical protein